MSNSYREAFAELDNEELIVAYESLIAAMNADNAKRLDDDKYEKIGLRAVTACRDSDGKMLQIPLVKLFADLTVGQTSEQPLETACIVAADTIKGILAAPDLQGSQLDQ